MFIMNQAVVFVASGANYVADMQQHHSAVQPYDCPKYAFDLHSCSARAKRSIEANSDINVEFDAVFDSTAPLPGGTDPPTSEELIAAVDAANEAVENRALVIGGEVVVVSAEDAILVTNNSKPE